MLPFPVDPEKDTICDVIRRWAEIQPDAAAMVAEDKNTLTYGEFSQTMDDIRKSLNRAGFGRGNRIGIIHSGGPDLATTLFGVASGATAIPLNPRYTAAEFTRYLCDRSIDFVLVEEGLESDIRQSLAELKMPSLEIATADPGTMGRVTIDPGPLHGSPQQPGRAQPEDLVFVLATSGTTTRSKVVPYRHRHLVYRAQAHAELFQLTENDRCLNVRPLHYGSQPLLAAVFLTGGSVALMPGLAATKSIDGIDRLSPTWVTGGFTYYQSIYHPDLPTRKGAERSRIRFLNVGSGRLPADVADGLERVFNAPVIEGYSSTEMSRIAGNPLPPGRRKRGTVGRPVGCEVRIRSLDGEFVPVGQRGEVMVKSPQGIEGYENDPEANAEAFVDGWFRTGDEGFFDEDGYLTLTGRIKEMINRGGEKVSPAEVDAALMGHPDLQDATTFPIPHPTLGEEVAAAVVQAPGGAALTDQILTKYLLGRLSGFKVPRRFYFVDEIPKSDAGKVQRYRLAVALGLETEAGSVRGADLNREPTPLEAQLQRLWAKALRLPHVGLNDNFFLLGGDSLQAVDMFLNIEKELGQRLPRAALFAAGTVAEMACLIEDDGSSNCIVPIQEEGPGKPFFCVHDGNGDVLNFRDLAKHMGEGRPFYGIQCVGLDGKEMPFTRIEDMAAHYISEIKKVQTKGPYFIGGYSFGGRVAYVMAQEFQTQGNDIALLAILDTSAGIGRVPLGAVGWFRRHLSRLRGLRASDIPAYVIMRIENVSIEFRRLVMTRLFTRALSYYESRTKPIPHWLYRPVEANDVIRRTAQLAPYDGDAVLFQTAESKERNADGKNGWGDLIKGQLKIVPVPGQHYQIVKEPHAKDLAGKLVCAIEAVEG